MIGLLSFLLGDNIAERAARYTFLMRKYKMWREEDDACELPELPRRDKELAKKDARYCYWASIESPTARLAIYRAARTESGKIRLTTGPNGAHYEVEKEKHEISEREFRLLKKRLKEMTDEYWAELIDGTTFKGATFFVYLRNTKRNETWKRTLRRNLTSKSGWSGTRYRKTTCSNSTPLTTSR